MKRLLRIIICERLSIHEARCNFEIVHIVKNVEFQIRWQQLCWRSNLWGLKLLRRAWNFMKLQALLACISYSLRSDTGYLLKKYFWWLLRQVKNLGSTACKHYRKCDVIYTYLHIELIWCLLMVQYLQNNVIMKWTTRFIRFTGWIPLKYGTTTTPPIIAHCQASYFTLRSPNLQHKTHPEFWPSHRWILKTSLYYKTPYIRDKTVTLITLWISNHMLNEVLDEITYPIPKL